MEKHNPVKWVKPKRKGIIMATGTEKCDYCQEEAISSRRCTHCDRYMCDGCWHDLDGYKSHKDCPNCVGTIYN